MTSYQSVPLDILIAFLYEFEIILARLDYSIETKHKNLTKYLLFF